LQATVRNIDQNLFFAFVYNAVGVPLGGEQCVAPAPRAAVNGRQL